MHGMRPQVCGGGALGLLREEELELLICGQRHLDFQARILSWPLVMNPNTACQRNVFCSYMDEASSKMWEAGLSDEAEASGGSLGAYQCIEQSVTVLVQALQQAARYEGGYSAEHFAVKAFWEVVKALPLEQKRAFLAFATGSDRCCRLSQ